MSKSEPVAPKPKRLKDWIGCRCRLIRALETNGGAKFKAGSELWIYSTWRGLLNLDNEKGQGVLRKVHPSLVELLVGRFKGRCIGCDQELVAAADGTAPVHPRPSYNPKDKETCPGSTAIMKGLR